MDRKDRTRSSMMRKEIVKIENGYEFYSDGTMKKIEKEADKKSSDTLEK